MIFCEAMINGFGNVLLINVLPFFLLLFAGEIVPLYVYFVYLFVSSSFLFISHRTTYISFGEEHGEVSTLLEAFLICAIHISIVGWFCSFLKNKWFQ
jgi:hypothetical protein